jgi:CTP:phosphocholine cytidylyltransferase-like protein
MNKENVEQGHAVEVIPANLDHHILAQKYLKLKHVQRLRSRSRFFGYLLEKCTYEMAKLLNYYNVVGGMRLDYYNIMRCYVQMFYRLNGQMSDEIFNAIVEKFRQKSGGRIHYDKKVLQGIKEMVSELWKMREALKIEFDQIQYLKRLEESGKKVDWETLALLELEFAAPKPDEKKEEGGK